MTVGAFAELVLELVGRNTSDFQVDQRVPLAVSETIILNIISRVIKKGEAIPSSYFKSYIVDVQTDTDMNRKYFQFVPPVLKVGDNDGIAYVGAKDDEYDKTSSYIILRPSQLSQMAGLEAQHMGGRSGVRVEGDRGYLYGEPPLVDKLMVRIIPEISKLKESDEMFGLDLTPFGISEPDYVLNKTVQYILNKRRFPEDKQTDNQSN